MTLRRRPGAQAQRAAGAQTQRTGSACRARALSTEEPQGWSRGCSAPGRRQGHRRPRAAPGFLPGEGTPWAPRAWRAETCGWAAVSPSPRAGARKREHSCPRPPPGQARATFASRGPRRGGWIVELRRENHHFHTELKYTTQISSDAIPLPLLQVWFLGNENLSANDRPLIRF